MTATLLSPYLLSWQLFIQGTSWHLPMGPMITLPYSHTIFTTARQRSRSAMAFPVLQVVGQVKHWRSDMKTQGWAVTWIFCLQDQCSTPYTLLTTKRDGRLRWFRRPLKYPRLLGTPLWLPILALQTANSKHSGNVVWMPKTSSESAFWDDENQNFRVGR